MRNKILWLLAVGLLAGPVAAQATLITFDFQGATTVGDTVSGTLVYDDSIAPCGSALCDYPGAVVSFSISGPGFTDTLEASDPGIAEARIQIRDGVSNGQFPVSDQFVANLRDGQTSFSLVLVAGTSTPPFTNPPCISGTALPSPTFSYDLSCFNSTVFIYSSGDVSVRAASIRAAEVSSVPEPSTLALFGLALSGLALTRRRRTH